MSLYIHSVALDEEKCKGCTNCVKRCPTEAIRIRDGHAVITSERCIDCGECIRLCPYNAKKAVSDSFEIIEKYKWKIALPAPAMYGQFDNLDDIDYVISGLIKCGFDDVYEVAKAAELVSAYTRRYISQSNIKKPVISSACPVIARLISVRFPYLCDNLLPILPPVEIAAKLAKEEAQKKHPELLPEEIGVFFISPCPAKASYVKNPIGVDKSAIDGVLAMNDIYFRLIGIMKKDILPEQLSETGIIGISWAGTGGEATALFNDKYLAADGIENIIKVLDEIENENFAELEFIELNACHGGCVGGALTVENPYIAKARLQNLRRYLPVSRNRVKQDSADDYMVPCGYLWNSPIKYIPVSQLDDDREEAMKKMADIQSIYERFPHLDCGSCGAPTCRAFAEDIIKGDADITGCIFILREMFEKSHQKPEDNSDDSKYASGEAEPSDPE